MTTAQAAAYRRMNYADATIDEVGRRLEKDPKDALSYVKLPSVYDAIAAYYGRSAYETLKSQVEEKVLDKTKSF